MLATPRVRWLVLTTILRRLRRKRER